MEDPMSAARGTGADRRGMTWPQQAALAFGVIYLLVGIIGFFITGFDNFFGNDRPPIGREPLPAGQHRVRRLR